MDAAERYGLDVIWLAELLVAPTRSVLASPLTVAAAIASRTKRVKIGIAVQVLPLCHPLRLAEDVATVDHISQGRLIFGVGPIPRLGIAGAGIAFGVYYVGTMLVLLRYMRSGRSGLTLGIVPLEWCLFAAILKVGLPTAINAVQTNLCVILVTGAVGLFGTAALAGYGIASRLDYVMIPILFGLSSAVLAMVGINVGAGNGARARRIAWIGGWIGAGMTEMIGLFAAIAPSLWLRLFTDDVAVIAPGTTYLSIVGLAYGLFGFGFVISFAGQGAGTMLWPTLAATVRLGVAAGLGWIAVGFLDGRMVTLSLIVALSFAAYAAVACLVVVTSSAWRPHLGRSQT